jgi:DNA-binding response OmpR family regulator
LLPRTDLVAADAGTPRKSAADADGPRRFVLLVDDDPGPRDTLRRLLVHEGFMVEVADSGPVALRVLDTRGDRCLAIVTDYMMPHMSGRELLERLRLRWPVLPALLISGFTPDDGTAGMLERLNVGFLAKPFTGRELAAAIRQHTQIVDDADAPIRPVPNPA